MRLESLERRGRLLVESSIASATLTVDGRSLGSGRDEIPLPAGAHQIELQAAGYQSFRRTVQIGATGLVRLDVTLARRTSPGAILPPVVIVAGVLVAGAFIAAAVYQYAPREEYVGSWGNGYESR